MARLEGRKERALSRERPDAFRFSDFVSSPARVQAPTARAVGPVGAGDGRARFGRGRLRTECRVPLGSFQEVTLHHWDW